MHNRTRLIVVLISFILCTAGGLNLYDLWRTETTFSKATIKYGSTGSDVRELQGRLKYLGYYHGEVDGIFGYKTLQSVKHFQSAFGMKVDGIAGSKTKLKLWEATKAWRPGQDDAASPPKSAQQGNQSSLNMTASSHLGLSETDLRYMANAVYGEARGEPYEGQVAVAAVILNRLKSSNFPNTIYGVIFEPRAFTAVADGQIWLTPDEKAMKAVRDALNGWDPTGGCVYYFNPDTATSAWIWSRPQVKRIGKHIFCM
ncbi:spore cortex-lytic enzyme [Insulibacter thermoxylanivorax]|uniref:Spore cortex-lytic enzyme n=1 Tax=Insulibacter thermoxylanivorax TaxID=2749268 RepID=A0A916QBP4_9BACL|nr:spore cortex-lytic enzyme [Insulibacter thermoxylanivorax]GFR37665.1 spore cortex-lytic enzyme [Insulibacter thermoxylanivorax]